MRKKPMQGFNFLAKGEIKKAIEKFDEGYFQDPDDLDVQMGRLFCDLALQNPSKGIGMGEFYFLMRKEEPALFAKERVMKMIEREERIESEEIEEAMQIALNQAELMECITLSDFKNFVQTKRSFKEAFEDFTLSTKIMFSSKSELYEFLNLLLEEGYAQLTLQYAQNVGENMGFDPQISQILQKAVKYLNEN